MVEAAWLCCSLPRLMSAADPASFVVASSTSLAPWWTFRMTGAESAHHLVQAVTDQFQFIAGAQVDAHVQVAGGDRAGLLARRSMLPMVA
jgi:hypothetical protein